MSGRFTKYVTLINSSAAAGGSAGGGGTSIPSIITVANYSSIIPSSYRDGQVIETDDTGVLWVKRTADNSIEYVHRAIAFGRLVEPQASNAFHGDGVEIPSDQGWAPEIETNNGDISATDGTLSLSTTTSGDIAWIVTDSVESMASGIVASDFSDLIWTGTGPNSSIFPQTILGIATDGSNNTYYSMLAQSTNWGVQGRLQSPINTGVSCLVAAHIEFYVDVSTGKYEFYVNRASLPSSEGTLTPTATAGSGDPLFRVRVIQNAAGSGNLSMTRVVGLRAN